MQTRYFRPISRMYALLIGLLAVVLLTGFIDKGRSVIIDADGRQETVYTHAVNAAALLREANIPVAAEDEVELSTTTLEDGSVITIRRAVPVTLVYKGEKRLVATGKRTVAEVLPQYGYDRENYRAYEDANGPVQKDMTIHIGSLSRKVITEDAVVPFAIESIPDEDLGQGEEKVLQQGVNGRKRVQSAIISLDGKTVGREVLHTELITEMQPLIRHVGTKAAVEINTGTITKYSKVLTMEATAYLPTDGNGAGLTKLETRARYGEIAVDPNVIPLGTTVFIPGYGIATAEDTGGDILGNRIDLCMEDYTACMAFGRRTVLVYILE